MAGTRSITWALRGRGLIPPVGPEQVRLHFLGTGDAFGNGGRYQTCFWLEGSDESLLIDCGATSLSALKAAGVEPNDIDFVALTHLHGDHFGGLPFLILDGQFRRRTRPLIIAGPPDTERRVHEAMEVLFPGSTGIRRGFKIAFVEVPYRERTSLGSAVVTSIPVEQPETPACALRIEYGERVVAYSGDTAWSEELVGLAEGADVFVAEAYFFDRKVPFHLDYRALVERRDALRAKRIVLTHMSPGMLGRQTEAEFECAYDGMVVSL